MDIMIGVEDSVKEKYIELLADSGATEFFCGIMPKEWVDAYNYQISLNKREWKPNQFHSFEKLSAAAKKVHSLKKKIAVAFNAHYYTREQLPLIEKYLGNLKEIGVDALIIGSIPLLLLARDMGLNIPVYISGEAGVYNYRSLEFFKKSNVKRIIFPRDMSTYEMNGIIKKSAGFNLEYEAFVMSERCVYSAGYCRTSHGYSNCNFCHQNWKKELYVRLPADFLIRMEQDRLKSVDEIISKPSLKLVKNWNNNVSQYRFFTDCRISPAERADFSFWSGCGLCAISKLKEIGITAFKIVSRGTRLNSKLILLKTINGILKNINNRETDFIEKIRKNNELCELGYICYYGETRGENG